MQWLFHAHLWEEKQLRQDFLELKKFVLKLAPGALFSQGLLPRGLLGRWQGRDRLAGLLGWARAQARSGLAATAS